MHDHTKLKSGLVIPLIITSLMMLFELVGGLLSNSLALVSDAGHMFTDALALGASLFALFLVQRPATKKHTYGYLRAEILVALFNGTMLILVSTFIFYEAYKRLFAPVEIKASLMLVVAIAGLIANLIGMRLLEHSVNENLNIRSAFWHMLGDTLSSIGVIIGGLIVLFTGWRQIDAIISFLIGIIILRGAVGVITESANILLESVPKDIDLELLISEVKKIGGVNDFHDIHLWTIGSKSYALSGHLSVHDQLITQCDNIREQVEKLLSEKFSIQHTTLQLECKSCNCSNSCTLDENSKEVHS